MNVTQLIARGSDARGYTLDYKTPYAPDVERRIDQIQRLSPAQRDAAVEEGLVLRHRQAWAGDLQPGLALPGRPATRKS